MKKNSAPAVAAAIPEPARPNWMIGRHHSVASSAGDTAPTATSAITGLLPADNAGSTLSERSTGDSWPGTSLAGDTSCASIADGKSLYTSNEAESFALVISLRGGAQVHLR